MKTVRVPRANRRGAFAPMRIGSIVALSSLVALVATSANANEITYCDFGSVAGLTLNAPAVQVGKTIQLTTQELFLASSVYRTAPFPLTATTSFHTHFQVLMSGGADGITFILQPNEVTRVGGEGQGIGYSGIESSVVVELDTYQNAWDPDANHVAITSNGDQTTHLAIATPAFMLASNGPVDVWIDYAAATKRLDVFVSATTTKPATPLVGVVIDVFGIVGATPFVGFTAGTGSESQDHFLRSWVFSTTSLTECIACTTDADCPAATHRCAPTGYCVGCLVNADCGTGRACDVPTNTCTGCRTDADCTDPKKPACATAADPNASACVECTATNKSSCKAEDKGTQCLMDGTCGCAADVDCGGPTSGRICDAASKRCAAGCRGAGGNGCAAGQLCSSTSAAAGTCGAPPASPPVPDAGVDAAPEPIPTQAADDGGCSCRTALGPADSTFGPGIAGLLAAAAAVVGLRRRARSSGAR